MVRRAENPPPNETHEDRFQHDIEELEKGSGWRAIVRGIVVVAVSLAAVIAVYYVVGKKPPPPRMTAKGALYIEPLEPAGGKLSAVPTTFRWESVAGRKDYRFQLLQKGNPIPLVERSVLEASATLTPDEASRLTRGASYIWVVEARGADGKVLGSGRGFFDL